jgi:putative N6-adenine-specific DNA methylase
MADQATHGKKGMDTFFAAAPPGLEPFTAQELFQLEIPSNPEGGGVTFKSSRKDLYKANLHLRTSSRILARLGNFFYATTFDELRQRAARLPWERFIHPGQPVSLHVTCHHSRLFHSDAAARNVLAALEERLGKPSPLVRAGEGAENPAQLIVVRLVDDRCTVSVDSSGELLHKRGYRLAVAKAPLRENLAAGILMASGWDKKSPLIDPFCGSGTIPIEAAMMALGLPPGRNRRFAFMDWPDYDAGLWQETLAGSVTPAAPAPLFIASDRDAGAVRMAQENADRAGVAHLIEFKCQSISDLQASAASGWIVTNPPYGERVSQGKDLRNLYARFGTVVKENCPGWTISVLCSDPILLGQVGLDFETALQFDNGGIPVRLGRAKVA